MNKSNFRKYIKYVLILLIILAFAALYFFVFKKNVVSYPKSSWLNSIFPTLSFSDESENISSDFFSYNLPLEKFPNNYDEIVNGILKKDFEYKEKVLLIRNGNLILDNSSNSFSDQIESIESSEVPFFLGSNLVLNDFFIQINEIETLMKKEFETEFVYELKVSLSSSEDLYNQVKEEKSKEVIIKNVKQLYSSISIFEPEFEIPVLIKDLEIEKTFNLDESKIENAVSNLFGNSDDSDWDLQMAFLSWAVKNSESTKDWENLFNLSKFVYGKSLIPNLKILDEEFQLKENIVTEKSLLEMDLNFSFSLDLTSDSCLSKDSLDLASSLGSVYAQSLNPNYELCEFSDDSLKNIDDVNFKILTSYAKNSESLNDFLKNSEFENIYNLNNLLSSAETLKREPNEVLNNSSFSFDNEVFMSVDKTLLSNLFKVSEYLKDLLDVYEFSENLNNKISSFYEDFSMLTDFENPSLLNNSKLNNYLEKVFAEIENLNTNWIIMTIKNNEDLLLTIGPEFQYSENSEIPSWLKQTVNDENFSEDYDIEPLEQVKSTVRIPALMYHQIDYFTGTGATKRYYITPESFEKQLAYLLSKNYKVLTIDKFYNLLKSGQNPTQKSILLTFDDGKENNYTYAYPLLKKYGMTGIFYVPSNKRGITSAQLKEMSDNGMIIDSHSATHIDLKVEEDDEKLKTEIVSSKYILESITGKTVKSFCYPGCVANQKTFSLVSSSGYILGFSCGSTIDHRYSQRFSLSRMHAYDNMDNFKKILSGYFEIPSVY